MANLKRTPVTYRPFTGQAILADGLLAVERPGGQSAAHLAQTLFGVADVFRQQAERTAQRKGREAGLAAGLGAAPHVTVEGGAVVRDPVAPLPDPAPAASDPNEVKPPVFTNAPGGPPQPVPAAAAPDDAAPDEATPVANRPQAGHASGTVQDAIARAAARHGVPVGALLRIGQIESKLNPAARNPNSSAGGLFQQIDSNAAQYGVANRFDPYQSADGAARMMRDNMRYLTKVLGREPTWGELYLAHQQGPGGAAKLLANPDAPAASVVGANAVRLNGGRDGMTAGQFAAMWTSKAGNAAAGAVTPSAQRRTPLSIQTSGGGLQMTGRDTIFGRAFDEAAGTAYKAALEDEMLSASAQLFDTFGDEPEMLGNALNELRARQMQDHVPEQFAAEYGRAFSRIERSYLAKAQKAREARIDAEDRSEFDGAASRYAEGFSRASAGLDPDNPDSLGVLAAEGARLKEHHREAVRRGYMTQAEADAAAARIDGSVASQWHVKQAEGKTADEIAGMREEIRKDYAAGALPDVNAESYGQIDTSLRQAETVARRNEAKAARALAATATGMIDRAADGSEIPEAEIEQLRSLAAGAEGGAEIAANTVAILDLAKLLRSEPVGVAEKKLETMRAIIGEKPTEQQSAMLRTAEAMIAKSRKSLAADPLGHAFRAGVIEDPGAVTDMKSADELAGFVGRRIALADEASGHFGAPARVFRPGEVAALEAMVTADPAQGAAIAGSLVVGAGPRAGAVLKEFGRGAPVMAGAGAIMAGGGDVRAAQDAIAGAGKGPDGKAYSTKGAVQRRQNADTATGSALVFQPEDRARVVQTAEWITRKRLADQGLEADAPEAADIHARALNEAAGAVYDGDVQWGGFTAYDPAGYWAGEAQVAVPNGIRADRFDDVVGALRDGDVKVGPVGGMAALQGLWPVLTAKGYVFVNFDAEGGPVPIEGTDGKAFVADLEALAPVIGPRVPGAMRGY